MQASNVTVGVGIDPKKGVFIQEYWRGENPFYAIANLRKVPVKIKISEWVNKQVGKHLIGPVEVDANAVVRARAASIGAERELVAVSLDDGTLLGLLRGPGKPLVVEDDRIRTIDGLNGLGGKRRDVICVQDELAYAPGQEFKLYLTIPDRIGKAQLSKTHTFTSYSPSTLIDVTSDSVPVTQDDRGYAIDATSATRAKESHVIALRVKAPQKAPPAMLTINGRITTPQGAGFSFTRGIPLELPPRGSESRKPAGK
jgi:hypothetical protein